MAFRLHKCLQSADAAAFSVIEATAHSSVIEYKTLPLAPELHKES